MSPEHKQLIQEWKEVLDQDSRVVAVWLEGSIARNEDDDYSDIDLWIAVKDSHFLEFVDDRELIAAKIGPVLSVLYPLLQEPAEDVDTFQVLFHELPVTLSVDVYVQKASRPVKIMEENPAEECMIVFDKSGLIKTTPRNESRIHNNANDVFDDTIIRFWHMLPRVRTLIERNDMLEAMQQYNERLLDLVTLYRIASAPEKVEWGMKDIEYDLPEAAVKTIVHLAAEPNPKQLLKKLKKMAMLFSKQSIAIGKELERDVPTILSKTIIHAL